MRKWPTSLCFLIYQLFLLFLLFFLTQWLNFFWASFQFNNFWESTIQMISFYHGVAKCSAGHFAPVFRSNLRAFLCIFQPPLSWSLCSGYHWKDLSLLQKLSTPDANFGRRWWREKWNNGQCSSPLFTAGTAVNRVTQIIKIPLKL